MPYLLLDKYKTILDVYDRFEASKGIKLYKIEITFFPHRYNNYLSTTKFYFKSIYDKIIKRKVLGNSSIYNFISIDFSIHNRFFYQKNLSKYLEVNKILNLLKTDSNRALVKASGFPYLQEDMYLKHNDFDFSKHTLLIGASGTGKSKLVSLLIKNLSLDSLNRIKYKFIVIDPHSSIEEDIGGLDDCKVLDFKTNEDSINLFVNRADNLISSTESILEIFKNIIKDKFNSKLERVLRYSIFLLLNINSFNLVNLRKLLIEIEYRNEILRENENILPINITEFFKVDFNELKTKSYQEAISPIISFIDEMQFLPAFNNNSNLNDFKDVIDNNFITILSLDQTSLGLNLTKTISGFAMQSIMQLIQAHSFKEHIILVIDEVSIIQNNIINRFLSEARKYNLSLILANQYFEQIDSNLQKAIFTNVVNYFIFRVSRMDASILENNIKMEVAVNNSHINRVKILMELEDRECIVRVGKEGKLYSAFKGKTMDLVPCPRIIQKKANQLSKNIKKIDVKQEFDITTRMTLKDLMKKQSASRKKLN